MQKDNESVKGSLGDSSKELDDDLVEQVRRGGDQHAFQRLVERHNSKILGRFIKSCGNRADAEDLCQQLWTRVARNIDRYQAEGRFEHYINTIATNLLHNHRDQSQRSAAAVSGQEFDPDSRPARAVADTERRNQVEQLVSEFIPRLRVEQRTAFLLRHESEFWQDEQRLSWDDLAMLNGIDVATAWDRFDRFRRSVFADDDNRLRDSEEACVFFVWSQSQRPGKQFSYNDDDFCEMLGVKPETFRTRYRTALRSLVRMREGQSTDVDKHPSEAPK